MRLSTAGRSARFTALLLAGLALGAHADEANYQPYLVGDRAAGMGGAVSATAEGMDASFYNPAGLAREQQDSLSINGTLYGLREYKLKDAAFPGEDIESSTIETIPTGLSAVRKLKDGSAVAFSIFEPSRSSAREIQAFPEQEHYYNYSEDEQTLHIGPSIGHAINDRLSVGASIFGTYQTASQFENLYWGDYAYTYSANYKYSVLGLLATVGTQYRIADEWFAGATITTPSTTLDGDGRVQLSEVQGNESAAGAGAAYYDDLDADNGLPASLRIGLGWKRAGRGSVGLDLTHHFSRSFNWMDGQDITIRQKREAVTDVQVGGEYILRERYPLRAGFFTSFSSAQDLDASDPSTPNQIDLYGVTASAGVLGKSVVMNFGLSYVFGTGDSFGTRLDDAGQLHSVISEVSERSLYAFASTAYRY